MQFIDKTGQRFGYLTVTSKGDTPKGETHTYWNCLCDCGNTTSVITTCLREGKTRSCGCLRNEPKSDLTGEKYGKLTVLGLDRSVKKSGVWSCKCDCGTIKSIKKSLLLHPFTPTQSCGCLSKKHFIDLTGQKFNNLTVTKYLGKDNSKNNVYLSTCDCGGTIQTQGSDVKTGKIKSCGCKNFTQQAINTKARGVEPLVKSLFAQYKRAGRRGYDFALNYEYFKSIILKDCTYCGSSPSNIKKDSRASGDRVLKYNGIDRIDNDIGYTVDNTVPCCRSCNIAKHTYTVDKFKELITKIYTNFILKDPKGVYNGKL